MPGKLGSDDELLRLGNGDRVEAIIGAARKTDRWQTCKQVLELGELRWRPHLLAKGRRRALLQVQLTDVLQPYLVQRLNAAHSAGWKIHLVVDVGSLHSERFVDALTGIDVTVHIVNEDGTLARGRDLLALLGLQGAALPRTTRARLALSAWERRNQGTNQDRGRRLEGLLAFLFGQVAGLRVVELNLRSATEEIDIVLQSDHDVRAPWYQSGVPFILVESKNWTSTVGSSEVSSFLVKLTYKRGRCRIGIMCAANGFSPEAKNQELRLAATEFTIVMIDPDMVGDWIRSEDPNGWLDKCVRRAMLR